MQFFWLIIVNVCLGAFFYLIISLKLEKSASEFREKKLRKEMDEIIKEFNVTADRNISILENKINVLKRMLEQAGDLKSIDVSVGDTIIEKSNIEQRLEKTNNDIIESEVKYNENINSQKIIRGMGEKSTIDINSESGMSQLSQKLKNIFNESKNLIKNRINNKNKIEQISFSEYNSTAKEIKRTNYSNEPQFDKTDGVITNNNKLISKVIEKSNHKIDANNDNYENDVNEVPMTVYENEINEIAKTVNENEINSILDEAADKYSAISTLHEKGVNIETIARYSGVPEGEIKLVLNLHNS